MKNNLILLLLIFSITSCKKLDKKISDKVDRILSSDHFELFTYRVICMSHNKCTLTKTKNDTIVFTTELDTNIIIKRPFTTKIKNEIRSLLEKSYNNEIPNDTGPGNMNRFYWFFSDNDTIDYFNNEKDIYKMFVEIIGETVEHLDGLDHN